MANLGNKFRDSLINMILDWNIEELKIYREPYVGSRFIGAKRKLNLILEYNGNVLGIEAKTQQTSGAAYQKLPYTIEDISKIPMPTIIVVSGDEIKQDVKALLISSGVGIEIKWNDVDGFGDGEDIFKQRVMIELKLDWLSKQKDKLVTKKIEF